MENGEWLLVSAKATRTVRTYDCCAGEYPDVTYVIQLRRRTMFYMINYILPCSLIAVLTLLVFVLPPESGERMSFGVTVMLSFTILVLMLMVSCHDYENIFSFQRSLWVMILKRSPNQYLELSYLFPRHRKLHLSSFHPWRARERIPSHARSFSIKLRYIHKI